MTMVTAGKKALAGFVWLCSFLVVVYSFSSVMFAGLFVAEEIELGPQGTATVVETPVSAATPYPYEGTYLRLAVEKNPSPVSSLAHFLGPSLAGGLETPLSPAGFAAGSGGDQERSSDAWVSQSLGYAAALHTLTYDFGERAPTVEYGESYIAVSQSGKGYYIGDVVFADEGDRRLLRDGRLVGQAPGNDPVEAELVREFPGVPRSLVEKKLSGPSAGFVFALEYVDSMTEGSLLGGRTVAATGTISGDGAVGAVGAVDTKIRAAEDAGAEVVFVPKGNTDSDPSLLHIPGTAVKVIPVSNVVETIRDVPV